MRREQFGSSLPIIPGKMNTEELEQWFTVAQQRTYISLLMGRVGVTRCRAECFVRLWIYLLLKQHHEDRQRLKPPLTKLDLPKASVSCTHQEAASLFYSDKDRGSDRAAGMMLDKLVALGLIKKHFDGNTTSIKIQPVPEIIGATEPTLPVEVQSDAFNPRCDAIAVAHLLASNYNWMNKNTNAVPYKIAKLLRSWASQYPTGMRVLRRSDNFNAVGFYILYPTASSCEVNFFSSPSKSLHLSSVSEIDPIKMATPGDQNCISVFVRSWMIDAPYLEQARIKFLEDVQQVMSLMRGDFPNLCDIHTLIIHPSYEELALVLGFQKTSLDAQLSVYWMYLPVDRFLAMDIKKALSGIKFNSSVGKAF